MNKTKLFLPEIKLVGIKIRTTNQDELNYELGKIFPCVQRYFNAHIVDTIPYRSKQGTTYCVYTDYNPSDKNEYSFFIGEEVLSFEGVPRGLEKHVIPPQYYAKFDVVGAMPWIVVNSWHRIWLMPASELGGKRSYIADFEIYEERSFYDKEVAFNIYIGIDKNCS